MPEPFENEEDKLDDINAENEIKKIKLALEHGMDLSKSFTNPDLPPELEGEFLDYIQQWEDQFAKREMTSIYDMAGKPPFRPLAEIPEDEVKAELSRVLEILHQNSIILDTLCPVDDRELYRFVTEELFNHETNNISIEGMMHCFTYEEFHPNHEYDIKRRCTELVNHITDKDQDHTIIPWCLEDIVWLGDIQYTKEELNDRIIVFRDSFSSFTLHNLQYDVVLLNEAQDEAEAVSTIHYTGNIDGSAETMEFQGIGRFHLKRESEWWTIHKFAMPGI